MSDVQVGALTLGAVSGGLLGLWLLGRIGGLVGAMVGGFVGYYAASRAEA